MTPKVSVLMSVYNGEKHLREAVDSILNQTFTDFEFIIINDGSSDRTEEILESYSDPRIRLFHQKNIGLTKSLNKALSFSRGQYIARLDSDDTCLPNRIERQVALLYQQMDTVILGSSCYMINEKGDHIGIWEVAQNDAEIRWEMLFDNHFCHSSTMLRSDILRRHGLFYDDRLVRAQDYDLWSRLLCYGKGYNIHEPLVKYRCHSNQVSELFSETQKSVADLIAQNNLKRINIHACPEEIRSLRSLQTGSKTFMHKEYVETCKLLLKILSQFQKQPYVDKTTYERLARRNLSKIYNALGRNKFLHVVYSGLLFSLFKTNLPFSFGYFLNRSFRFLKKRLSAKYI